MAEITAIVIPAELGQPLRQERIDPNDLSAYQALVGDHIEAVELLRPSASMYINGEGKLLGRPVNHRATALAAVHNSEFRDRDIVVGEAFVTGPLTATGRDTTVPAKYIDLWFEATSFRVQKKVGDSRRWVTKNYQYTDPHVAYVAAIRLARREPEVTDIRVVAR